jgi:hypothetical protein
MSVTRWGYGIAFSGRRHEVGGLSGSAATTESGGQENGDCHVRRVQ